MTHRNGISHQFYRWLTKPPTQTTFLHRLARNLLVVGGGLIIFNVIRYGAYPTSFYSLLVVAVVIGLPAIGIAAGVTVVEQLIVAVLRHRK